MYRGKGNNINILFTVFKLQLVNWMEMYANEWCVSSLCGVCSEGMVISPQHL